MRQLKKTSGVGKNTMTSRCRVHVAPNPRYVPVYNPICCPDPVNTDPRRTEVYCPPIKSRSEPLSGAEYIRKLKANGGRALSGSANTVVVGSATPAYATTLWMTAGGDCNNGADLVLPAVPAVHAGGHALDSGLLTEMRGANAGRGAVSVYDTTNRTEGITTLRRQGLAIAADDSFNAPAGQKRVLCKKCGFGPDCGPITLEEIASFDSATSRYTLFAATVITACQTLYIPSGILLQIRSGLQLINNGSINVAGTLDIFDGTVFNNGYINLGPTAGGPDGKIYLPNGSRLINKRTIDVAGEIRGSSTLGMEGIIYNSGGTINIAGSIFNSSLGTTAAIYNYGGGTINQAQNIAMLGGTLYIGIAGQCGTATYNGTPAPTLTSACPTAPYP